MMTIIVVFRSWMFLVLYITTIEAIRSDNCWDGTYSVDYSGTIGTTLSGRTCQNWADDTPHPHGYHIASDPSFFPYDGSDTSASNYCRDPDGSSGSSGAWCYTMDPSRRFEYCDIPLCTNLPCGGGEVIGQSDPSTVSSSIDSNSNRNYLQKDDAPYSFTCCGTIREWKIHIRNPGTIRLQAWRLDTGTGLYELLGENVYSYSAGEINANHGETVTQNARISIQDGDLIGWYTSGTDMISYATGTVDRVVSIGTASPSVGSYVDFSAALTESNKDYAIGVVVAESLSPSFDSTVTSITISADESIGNTIFVLTATDDDTDDITSLAVTMDPISYFNITGTDVKVKATLDAGTYLLNFTVTDRCTKTGVFSLTVTVTPATLAMTSLPTIANVSESATVEALIHNLTFTPTGNYTCGIDSYAPTRPEGNPFLIQDTPSSDVGVYLKNAAAIRYNIATSYNVTITCSSAATSSDTRYIIIDVDPNSHPVFASFQSSLTIDASTTLINTNVYNATVTDAEGDPIVMTLTCDPTPCPFIINNDGEITITVDPIFELQTTYTFIMTADDGFNNVTSSNVSVIISGINVKPFFTNLPTSAQSVLEKQPIGTSVFQAVQSDANGDATTVSMTYSSAACASMYGINTADGTISTLLVLDYETDTSCTLTLTGFDGIAPSDPEVLVVNIVDVDEPPVMSSNGFVINTEEVVSGTALPDASISATDPEGTAVSLSLNCGTYSGYLTIDSTSGIVTMATEYDIETAPSNPYTITCVITATDTTSQSSTASLDVIISDGNDNPPVFSPPGYSYFLSMGYTGFGQVGNVIASDADVTSPNNVITYSMTPTTSFNIGASGSIYNTVDLSGDALGTTYTLVVTATDGGTPALSDTATVVITVLSSTTTTTTTAASSATDASSSGFFSETGNIVFLALAIFVAALMAALVAFLVCRYCTSKPVDVEKHNMRSDADWDRKRYDVSAKERFHNKYPEHSGVHLGQPVPYKIPEVEPENPVTRQETSPRTRREECAKQRYHNKVPERPGVHLGQSVPYAIPEVEPERHLTRHYIQPSSTMSRTPEKTGDDRPKSNDSGIHVSPVQKGSTLGSIRRTHWLTDLAVSPRTPTKIQLDLTSK